ncbi:MAG: glycosyltransferase [Pseudomonadota bacterium]
MRHTTIGLNEGIGDIHLICQVGVADADILPHFLDYYDSLGVAQMHLVLHGNHSERTKQVIEESDRAYIRHAYRGQFREYEKISVLNSIVEELIGSWVLSVDVDEFISLPSPTLRETVEQLELYGATVLPAFLVQRLSKSGELSAVQPEDTLDGLFPYFDFNLCEQMDLSRPAAKTKFPLFKAEAATSLQRGFHFSPNPAPAFGLPARAVLSHFKWRWSLVDAKSGKRAKDANQTEMDAYTRYLKKNAFILPNKGALPFSREAIGENGLLVPFPQNTILQAETDLSAQRPKDAKICFVSFEIAVPGSGGGIATAVRAQIELLLANGYDVHLVHCPFSPTKGFGDFQIESLRSLGMTYERVSVLRSKRRPRDFYAFSQRLVERLKKQDFDIIHFDDVLALGALVAEHRAAGLGFQNTRIVMTTHGCTRWHYTGNDMSLTALDMELDYALQRQFLSADLVIHPSNYMREYLNANYQIDARQITLPNLLSDFSRRFSDATRTRHRIDEIVFFGRLELRKGLGTFMDALDHVVFPDDRPVQVTLLGSFSQPEQEALFRDHMAEIDVPFVNISNFGTTDAVAYLRTRRCVAIIPSVTDNLPYTVFECLENGIPFLSSKIGGIPELVCSTDQDRVLLTQDAQDWANKLTHILSEGHAPARLAFDVETVIAEHLKIYDDLLSTSSSTEGAEQPSTNASDIGVITAAGFGEAETHVLEQFGWSEDDLENAADHHIRLTNPQKNIPIHRTKDLIASLPHAYYLVLGSQLTVKNDVDIQSLISLMRGCKSDVVLFNATWNYKNWHQEPPRPEDIETPGGPMELGIVENRFGPQIALISKDAICRAIGTLSILPDYETAVWEVLNAAAASGARFSTYPKPIVRINSVDRVRYPEDPNLQKRLFRAWEKQLPAPATNVASTLSHVTLDNDMLVSRHAHRALFKTISIKRISRLLIGEIRSVPRKVLKVFTH